MSGCGPYGRQRRQHQDRLSPEGDVNSDHVRYCDIVMKGGITSGIVYPSAVLALAKRYTFKNIGGTSAGAIAAAACAAAALGERRKELSPDALGDRQVEMVGFGGLSVVAESLRQKGFIYGLFQPAPGAAAVYRLIVTLAGRPAPLKGFVAALRGSIEIAPIAFFVVLLTLLAFAWAIGGEPGVWSAAVPAIMCAVGATAVFAILRAAAIVRRNFFGICTGLSNGKSKGPALTEWLHEILQTLSGQDPARPLLFEDLWNTTARYPDEPGERAISLEMITTGISHHEPRRLPFDDSTFWFDPDEFVSLFPQEVVTAMIRESPEPLVIGSRTFHRLPAKARLPVLVATRMSLSFPLLLSAIPLYEAVRKSARPRASAAAAGSDARQRSLIETSDALAAGGKSSSRRPDQLRTCWFSDGGIGSNFPIHLFDAPLPRWPTFAIDLIYPRTNPDRPVPKVFLPTENNQGWQRRYTEITASSALGEIGAFVFAIIGTMQNWRDLMQSRAPGHRDRIVQIPLTEEEGGLNLDMPQAVLNRIAQKGAEAGERLVADFSFNNHWWIRWRTAASAVERFTIDFAKAASATPHASYIGAFQSARSGTPEPPSYPFTKAQQHDAAARLSELEQQGLLWEDTDPDLTRGAPKPLPHLRITPTF
jgi:predicted acylesterase/phospholipase RssA